MRVGFSWKSGVNTLVLRFQQCIRGGVRDEGSLKVDGFLNWGQLRWINSILLARISVVERRRVDYGLWSPVGWWRRTPLVAQGTLFEEKNFGLAPRSLENQISPHPLTSFVRHCFWRMQTSVFTIWRLVILDKPQLSPAVVSPAPLWENLCAACGTYSFVAYCVWHLCSEEALTSEGLIQAAQLIPFWPLHWVWVLVWCRPGAHFLLQCLLGRKRAEARWKLVFSALGFSCDNFHIIRPGHLAVQPCENLNRLWVIFKFLRMTLAEKNVVLLYFFKALMLHYSVASQLSLTIHLTNPEV